MLSSVKRRVERRRGDGEGDEGFTLIELLVVLLIIGILLAIAIPTFLSVTKSANDTAAQSNLQTALTGAKTYYTENNQTYTGAMAPSGIAAVDTGLSIVTATTSSSGPHVVSIKVYSGSLISMVAYANGTKNCWGILDSTASNSVDGQSGFTGTLFTEDPNVAQATCVATVFPNSTTKVGKSSTTGFSSVS